MNEKEAKKLIQFVAAQMANFNKQWVANNMKEVVDMIYQEWMESDET